MIDYKVSFNKLDSALNAAKLFELRKQQTISVISGNFKLARETQKQIAKLGVEDFEAYKALPFVNIKGVPPQLFFPALVNSIKFRIYSFFTRKTPEEKKLAKDYKAYINNLTPEEIQKKKLDITIPSLY